MREAVEGITSDAGTDFSTFADYAFNVARNRNLMQGSLDQKQSVLSEFDAINALREEQMAQLDQMIKSAAQQYEAIMGVDSRLVSFHDLMAQLSNYQDDANAERTRVALLEKQISSVYAAAEKQVAKLEETNAATLLALNTQISQQESNHATTIANLEAQITKADDAIAKLNGVTEEMYTLNDLMEAIATYEETKELNEGLIAGIDETLAGLEEQYLEEIGRLDGILSTAHQQLQVLNNIDGGIKTVASALAAFNNSVSALENAWAEQNAIVEAVAGDPATATGGAQSEPQPAPSDGSGVNLGIITLPDGTTIDLSGLDFSGIPGFADGGSHLGGWRVVGERGWELENTGSSQIYNQSQVKELINLQEVVSAVKEVTAMVHTTGYAIAKNTGEIKTIEERREFDRESSEEVVLGW